MKQIIVLFGTILLGLMIVGFMIGSGGSTEGTLVEASQNIVSETITEVGSLGD